MKRSKRCAIAPGFGLHGRQDWSVRARLLRAARQASAPAKNALDATSISPNKAALLTIGPNDVNKDRAVAPTFENNLWSGITDEIVIGLVEDHRQELANVLASADKKGCFMFWRMPFFVCLCRTYYRLRNDLQIYHETRPKNRCDSGCEECWSQMQPALTSDHKPLTPIFPQPQKLTNHDRAVIIELSPGGPTFVMLFCKGFATGDLAYDGWEWGREVGGYCFFLPFGLKRIKPDTPLRIPQLHPDDIQHLVHSRIRRCAQCLLPLADVCEALVYFMYAAVRGSIQDGMTCRQFFNDYFAAELNSWREIKNQYGNTLPFDVKSRWDSALTLRDNAPNLVINQLPRRLRIVACALALRATKDNIFTVDGQRSVAMHFNTCLQLHKSPRFVEQALHVTLPEIIAKKIFIKYYTYHRPFNSLAQKLLQADLPPEKPQAIIPAIAYNLRTLTTRKGFRYVWRKHAYFVRDRAKGEQLVELGHKRVLERINQSWQELLSNPNVPGAVKQYLLDLEKRPSSIRTRSPSIQGNPLSSLGIPFLVEGPGQYKALVLVYNYPIDEELNIVLHDIYNSQLEDGSQHFWCRLIAWSSNTPPLLIEYSDPITKIRLTLRDVHKLLLGQEATLKRKWVKLLSTGRPLSSRSPS